MRNAVISLVLLSFVVNACGGRTASPVMIQQYGDDKLSCGALESSMVSIQNEIARLLPESDKTGKNVALGVAGAFLLVPWFFMDLSQAEREEINAYRQRYNHLAIIANSKNCNFNTSEIPDSAPAPKK